MSISAFTVISEFKFDVAGAILGTEKLQEKVDGLSSSVGNALNTVQSLGMGFIANFSGASAGILGLLGNAISTSDKFSQSQLSLVQIIDSNMAHLTGSIGSMNEKMLVSQKIMNDISKDARKFGLPADALLASTKTLSAMLVPKGLAGDDFSGARTMSRNLLKSAPNLGIDPNEVQGQLLRSIEGSASMGDTLFRRLLTEAPEPFKQSKVKDAKSFNALDASKRFNILNDALAKFANNSKILEMRANTLSGTMQSVKDLFMSFNSVLKPLGDVLLKPIIEILQFAVKYIDTHGRQAIEAFSRFLKPFLESPKDTFLNLIALQDLAGNVSKSAGFVSLLVGLTHFNEIMHVLSSIPIVSGIVKPLTALYQGLLNFPIIGSILKSFMGLFSTGPITGFVSVLKVIGLTMLRMAGLFSILLIPLTGLSRALARMKLESLDWIGKNMASIIDTFNSLRYSISSFFAPISDMIGGWEELFFIILGGNSTLDFFKSSFESLASLLKTTSGYFIEWYASFKGLIAGMFGIIAQLVLNVMQMYNNLMSGNFSGILDGTENIFSEGMKNGAEEFMKTVDKYRAPTLGADGLENAKVSNAVNNYDVKMTNNFKEVLQPDRIAFTIQDQLEKSSRNRTSSGSKSISSQLARST